MEMQTTAEYDQSADEFIITTPTTLAQKYWVRSFPFCAHMWACYWQLYLTALGMFHNVWPAGVKLIASSL